MLFGGAVHAQAFEGAHGGTSPSIAAPAAGASSSVHGASAGTAATPSDEHAHEAERADFSLPRMAGETFAGLLIGGLSGFGTYALLCPGGRNCLGPFLIASGVHLLGFWANT